MRAGGWALAGLVLIFPAAFAQETPAPEALPPPSELDELRARLEDVEAELRALRDEPPPPPSVAASEGSVAAVGTEGVILELPLSMRLRLSGHLRVRGESRTLSDYRAPGTFGRPAAEDADDGEDFVLQRAWISLDFQFHEHLRGVVSIMDSRQWGDQTVGADASETYLREAFVEVQELFDQPLTIKLGRGLVPALGDQRLFSALDPWANVPRIWDGVQVTYAPKGWWVTGFASNLREANVQTPRGDEHDDFWLTGLYASCRLIEKHELDAYFVWRNLSDDIFANQAGTRTGDREDYTAGARLKGETGPLGYSGEAVLQWGSQAGERVQAFAAAAKSWFTQKLDEDSKLRLGVEYAFASGDQDPTDGVVETFDPIFPFGHFYHGHMDLMLWRNMHAVSAQAAVFPLPWVSLHLDGHVFWLDERADAWYGVGRTQRRDPTGDAGSHVGTELDAYVQVRLLENRLFLWTGYSHFWTGELVRDTGKSEDMDWAFAHLEFNF